MTTVSEIRERRQRADARRSVTAILEAAVALLGRRPEASMDEIAAAAGVSRQTIYAHYRSRDALLLARLLRMDEVVAVRVPGPDEEAARDLVRAREDARGDLMRSRHRLSKLLLRHGIVYAGGSMRCVNCKTVTAA